jgi:hypothetical protein
LPALSDPAKVLEIYEKHGQLAKVLRSRRIHLRENRRRKLGRRQAILERQPALEGTTI